MIDKILKPDKDIISEIMPGNRRYTKAPTTPPEPAIMAPGWR